MNESYHNTNNETGDVLANSESKAQTQEETILLFFQRHPRSSYTAEEIYSSLFSNTNIPLTSIRRAITNLMDKEKVMKLDEQRKGAYGKMIYCYQLKTIIPGDLSTLLDG